MSIYKSGMLEEKRTTDFAEITHKRILAQRRGDAAEPDKSKLSPKSEISTPKFACATGVSPVLGKEAVRERSESADETDQNGLSQICGGYCTDLGSRELHPQSLLKKLLVAV